MKGWDILNSSTSTRKNICAMLVVLTSTGKLSKMMKQTTHARHKRSIKTKLLPLLKETKDDIAFR